MCSCQEVPGASTCTGSRNEPRQAIKDMREHEIALVVLYLPHPQGKIHRRRIGAFQSLGHTCASDTSCQLTQLDDNMLQIITYQNPRNCNSS